MVRRENKRWVMDGLRTSYATILNRNTRSGTLGDARMGAAIAPINQLNRQDIDNLYRGSRTIQKIIDLYPVDSLKKLPVWKFDNDTIDSDEVLDALQDIECLDGGDFFTCLQDALQTARLYGDGFFVLGVDDGREMQEELNLDSVRAIRWVTSRDRWDVQPYGRSNLRNPEIYQLTIDANESLPEQESNTILVHRSRIIRFVGKSLGGRMLRHNNGYNDSILQGCYEDYMNYRQGLDAVTSMLLKNGMFKYKMAGLKQILEGGDGKFLDLLETIKMGISANNMLIMGATDDAEFVNQSFSGVKDLILQLEEAAIASADMPRSKLMGSSKSSALSEGGSSDKLEWAALVSSFQSKHLLKPLRRVSEILFRSSENGLNYDGKFDISFPSIVELTRKEESELREADARTFVQYLNSGVLLKGEVRNSLFGGANYTSEISLDESEWEESKENEKLHQELTTKGMEQALNEPTIATKKKETEKDG